MSQCSLAQGKIDPVNPRYAPDGSDSMMILDSPAQFPTAAYRSRAARKPARSGEHVSHGGPGPTS